MIDKIFYIFILISIDIFASNAKFTVKDAVNLSANSYLNTTKFKNIYKTDTNKINKYDIDKVRVYTVENEDYISIVFRGTSSKHNATTDLKILPREFLDIKDTEVHGGFYNVAVKTKNILDSLLDKNKPIYITGHSLGGAISILLGSLLNTEGYDVSVYTFGSPPVGNKMFIDHIEGLKHYRYFHRFDIVSRLDKRVIKLIQNKLKKSNRNQNNNQSIFLSSIKHLLINLNYNYVHDNYKKIMVKGKVKNKKEIQKLPLLFRFALTPLKYHSIEGYVKNI